MAATVIQVSTDSMFRQKVAEAVVEESHPGYHGQGRYYADPVEGVVYYAQTNRAWNPWSDEVDWRIVSVDELVNQDGNDFDGTIDWDLLDLPDRSMIAAYLESEGESFEENGDIPEWVCNLDVINFARDYSDEWQKQIEEHENLAYSAAISFALSEILDEIEIEIEEVEEYYCC